MRSRPLLRRNKFLSRKSTPVAACLARYPSSSQQGRNSALIVAHDCTLGYTNGHMSWPTEIHRNIHLITQCGPLRVVFYILTYNPHLVPRLQEAAISRTARLDASLSCSRIADPLRGFFPVYSIDPKLSLSASILCCRHEPPFTLNGRCGKYPSCLHDTIFFNAELALLNDVSRQDEEVYLYLSTLQQQNNSPTLEFRTHLAFYNSHT